MSRLMTLGSMGFVCLLVSACTFETRDGGSGGPGGPGGNAGSGTATEKPADPPAEEKPATPSSPGAGTACAFDPANAIGCESGPSADLGAACDSDALEIDTTSGKFACGIAAPSKLVDQGPGNPKIRVFYVNGLRIGRDSKVHVTGSNALAIVSRGDVVVEGVLDASAANRDCTAGPGGYRGGDGGDAKGENGGGPGGGLGAVTGAGAGGGSYGGAGGAGGNDTGYTPATGSAAGATYGNATLSPLVGGSGGGGDDNCGGGGGGAVQIVSSTSILIATGGGINVGGASSYGYRSGGGSGGAIFVEAPNVVMQGTLAANGGGGGYGCGGELASTPACGGKYDGGVGSSSVDGNGAPGASGDYASGGGGGAGRIRIATHSVAAEIAGTISPGFATTLSTQAEIAK